MGFDHLIAGCVTFLYVFLRGFQQKNIHGNHYIAAFTTSICMNAADLGVIYLVVKNGWEVFPYTAVGAGLGIVTAMWLHGRTIGKSVDSKG